MAIHLHDPSCDREEAQAIAETALARVRDGGAADLTLDAPDLLIRYELRRAGCVGGLRQPLRWMPPPCGEGRGGGWSTEAAQGSRSDVLARFVAGMVPGV